MLLLNSVRNWRADAICPYDLARIVFVGHDVYDVPIFCKINGVSQSVTPYKRHLKDICKPEFIGMIFVRFQIVNCLPCLKGGGFCEAKDGGILLEKTLKYRCFL